MAKALPHSKQIAQELNQYLRDLQIECAAAAKSLPTSPSYRRIFKNSLACSAVLGSLARRELPLVRASRSIAARCSLLLACRQLSLAYVDLRRFIEMVVWVPYFREHRIQWAELLENPGQGFTRDPNFPISFCAHRELQWYVSYIKERLRKNPCAAIAGAVGVLSTAYCALSSHVHAATSASSGGKRYAPLDDVNEPRLRAYEHTQRAVLGSACIVIAGSCRNGLGKLDAVGRAWFDWLIGTGKAKQVRAESFGMV